MIKSQVAQLFAIIAFYDARVQFDEGKLMAWDLALDGDMPFEFGKQVIVYHYADTTTAVMPAMLNERWRIEREVRRAAEKHQSWVKEIAAQDSVAIPMPKHLRQELRVMVGKVGMDLEVLKVDCPHCKVQANRDCVSPLGVRLTHSYAHPSRFEKAGIENAQVAVRKQ